MMGPGSDHTHLHVLLMPIQSCTPLIEDLHRSFLQFASPKSARRLRKASNVGVDEARYSSTCCSQTFAACERNNGWFLTTPGSVLWPGSQHSVATISPLEHPPHSPLVHAGW